MNRSQKHKSFGSEYFTLMLFAISFLLAFRGNIDADDGGEFIGEKFPAGGFHPYAIDHFDFNTDGYLDLAVANLWSGNVSILLGDGQGRFAVDQVYAVGLQPESLQLADFNNDGVMDMVVGNVASDDLSVLIGVDDGSFEPERRFKTGGAWPRRVAVADFDGDGNQDVAVANSGTEPSNAGLSVLFGNGAGDLGTGFFIELPFFLPAIDAGDFDNDAIPDIALHGANGEVLIFLGVGDGTFNQLPDMQLGVAGNSPEIIVEDLNNDGNLDLALLNGLLTVAIGFGDGTFATIQNDVGGHSFKAVDLNGDQNIDFVTGSYFGRIVGVLIGAGDGTFSDTGDLYDTGGFTTDLTVADFNQDGYYDIACTNDLPHDVCLIVGIADTQFLANQRFGSSCTFITSADVNNDGILDVIANGGFGGFGEAVVFLGNGDGTLGPEERCFVAPGRPFEILAGDFNADGNIDLATMESGADITTTLGDGSGTFPQIVDVTGSFNGQEILVRDGFTPVEGSFWQNDTVWWAGQTGPGGVVTTIDLGVIQQISDLLVSVDNNDTLQIDWSIDGKTWNSLTTIEWFYGEISDGMDTFSTELGHPEYEPGIDFAAVNARYLRCYAVLGDNFFSIGEIQVNGATPHHVISQGASANLVASDFNEDGFLDLAVGTLSGNVSVLFGLGAGDFAAEQLFPVNGFPRTLNSADINEDGHADMVATTEVYDEKLDDTVIRISLFLGAGDGSFQIVELSQIMFYPSPDTEIADVDGDSHQDILVSENGSIGFLKGNGDGTFAAHQFITPDVGPLNRFEIADLDCDGNLDLVFEMRGQTDGYGFATFLGLGDGSFAAPRTFASGNCWSLIVNDLNLDGRMDVATGSHFGVTISLNSSSDGSSTLYGDVNLDGAVNLLDVGPFIDRVGSGDYQAEADCNQDGVVNLLDVDPFIAILGGG